jgi:hypothetical protein
VAVVGKVVQKQERGSDIQKRNNTQTQNTQKKKKVQNKKTHIKEY